MILLYRGVNSDLYAQLEGKLIPKNNKPFINAPVFDSFTWDNAYWDECYQNEVINHQQNQIGIPTSGISTTPHLHRARLYATHSGKFLKGYIYIIDRSRLDEFGVSAYSVKTIVPNPSEPKDDEVILVAKDNGAIPYEVVIGVEEIFA